MSMAKGHAPKAFHNNMNDEIKIIKLLKGRDIYHVCVCRKQGSWIKKIMFHILTRTLVKHITYTAIFVCFIKMQIKFYERRFYSIFFIVIHEMRKIIN